MATPCWSRGGVVKVVDKVVHRDPEDPETVVERYRDRYVTTVATLSQHGLELIQDVDALTRLPAPVLLRWDKPDLRGPHRTVKPE